MTRQDVSKPYQSRHLGHLITETKIIAEINYAHSDAKWIRTHKKPYGNSAVGRDIAEILEAPDEDWVFVDGQKADPTDEAEERLMRLHVEAMFALQIVLTVGEFRPGRYQRSEWWNTDWRLVEDGR